MKIKELFPNKTRYYTPITVLYFLVIIIFTFFYHLPMVNHMGNFLSGSHAILMMIAISPRVKLKYKYILAILAMISLYLSMRFFPIDLNILHFMIFYIPFLYAYLLPDIISPLLVGIIFSRIFLVYEGQSSNGEIIGSIIGLYSSAIVHSIISLLVARLYDMKEVYRNLSMRDSLTGLYNLDYIIKKGRRIIQIADSYSAMTVKRVYRKTFDIEEAKEELIKNKNTQYDPGLVDIFVEIMNKKIKDKG